MIGLVPNTRVRRLHANCADFARSIASSFGPDRPSIGEGLHCFHVCHVLHLGRAVQCPYHAPPRADHPSAGRPCCRPQRMAPCHSTRSVPSTHTDVPYAQPAAVPPLPLLTGSTAPNPSSQCTYRGPRPQHNTTASARAHRPGCTVTRHPGSALSWQPTATPATQDSS